MLINGDIISCEPIVVYGRVSGDITSQKSVIIHRGATVGGKIKAQEVRVDGILEGAIEAQIVEIGKDGVVDGYMIASNITTAGKSDGDILAKNSLVVEEGAEVKTVEAISKVVKVSGIIKGDLVVSEYIEVNENGFIDGDIKTREYVSVGSNKVSGSIYRYVGKITKE